MTNAEKRKAGREAARAKLILKTDDGWTLTADRTQYYLKSPHNRVTYWTTLSGVFLHLMEQKLRDASVRQVQELVGVVGQAKEEIIAEVRKLDQDSS